MPPIHASEFRPKKLTTQDLIDGCMFLTNGDDIETRICVVNEELRQGLEFMRTIEKSITVFGSARTPINDPMYLKARRISKRAAEAGFAVITGGGPGMMEAANRGAHEAGGKSIGATIKLPGEQHTNQYVTDELPFYYFFTRKVALAFSSEVFVVMPGGFGTLDELFEIVTLMQTGKTPKAPIVLVGKDFWSGLDSFIKTSLISEGVISESDLALYTITDDEDEIQNIIDAAPLRNRYEE